MEKKLTQQRSYLDNCTISKVYHEGKFLLYTVECPWKSNIPFESCVPPGIYSFTPISTPKYKNSFCLENPDLGVSLEEGKSTRWGCLWHIANYPRQVEGCAGPGLYLQQDYWGVSQSTKAMAILNNLIGSDPNWKLEIV